jgi:hypothetical protein
METDAKTNWMCADCAGLAAGPRVPHEYLVRIGSDAHTYMCLICDTHFECETTRNGTSWTMLSDEDGNPRRFARLYTDPYIRQSLR